MDERSDRLSGSIDQARRAHYFAELMKLLVDAGGTLPRTQALEVLGQRLDLTPYELERTKTGAVRWRTHLQFHFTGFVKAGYLTRGGGTWRITEEGRAAMARWSPSELLAEMQRRYSAWDQERQAAGEPEAEVDDDPTDEGEGEKARIWLIGTGRGGTGWPRFRDGGFVEVGFARDAKGRPFGAIDTMTREQVRARMIEVTGEPNPYNDVLCAWQFAHEMRIGDLVIAKTGKSRVLGYGRISGDYECPTDSETFGHRRAVAWERKETVELPPRYLLATKTLTEIGRYDGFADVLLGQRTPAARRSLAGSLPTTAAQDEFFARHPYAVPPPRNEPETKGLTTGLTIEEIDELAFVPRFRLEEMVAALTSKLAIVLKGAPGTGKSWLAGLLAEHWAGDRSRVTRVQFHPATSYEDFVRGVRATASGGFRVQNGSLAEAAERARRRPDQRFVMLVDEINRANVAKVLGEALSLLEADKRDARHAVELGLDLEGERRFWLPANLAFVATMNTSDRSIAMVDYALRRRFAFFELAPAYGDAAFRDWLVEQLEGSDDGDPGSTAERSEARQVADRVVRVMAELNRRVVASKSLGPGFALGHSYFCSFNLGLVESPTSWMRRVFRTEVAPQVEEYCAEHPRLREELLEPLREVLE